MYILYALQVSMVIKGWLGQLNFQIALFSVAFLLISWPHQSVTVAQVHPTLLENNGYKTMPIKTMFWRKNVKYQHWQRLVNYDFLNTEEKCFYCDSCRVRELTVSVMDGTAWLKLRPFLETLTGKCTLKHTHTHTWILWNQRGAEEIHYELCAEAAADCPSTLMLNQFPSTHF